MNKNDITIVLVTSVLPSHPDTHIIDETISSIRSHFPDNEIILQIDGLRDEQKHRKDAYDEWKNRVLWKCMHQWKNVLPFVFEEHCHQTTMMSRTINEIITPILLYVEGDAPLVPDRHIDWDKCLSMLSSNRAYTIRFHFEETIPVEHNHLMLGHEDDFMKTIQWSQRPHLSFVNYYKENVLRFSKQNFFIEDIFHGVVQDDYSRYGNAGWNRHKLWIYYPNGGNKIKRSYHLDGREGTRKFTSDDDVWGYKE